MSTRYGQIEIANCEPFSCHLNGFGVSPYLQEKLVYLGQLEVYKQASEIACTLLGLAVCQSQIYRLTTYYGQAIENDLNESVIEEVAVKELAVKELAVKEVALIQVKEVSLEREIARTASSSVVYAQIDGAMLLTDQGYKENKLARIFKASAIQKSKVKGRAGGISKSLYTAHLGCVSCFNDKLKPHLEPYQDLKEDLVFISDGALWISNLINTHYPQATLILDLYHVMSHVGVAALEAYREGEVAQNWIENQKQLLLESQIEQVIENIKALSIQTEIADSICNYLISNALRMNYKLYLEKGLCIGSGAIEAAHRTVVQKRLKRSGQRWSKEGAQKVLNLRVCLMSERWDLVRNRIEPSPIQMAA